MQVYCGRMRSGVDGLLNWDAHKTLKADYERHGPIMDQPTAALLKDLKQRGLLEDTLVLWTTEFGRMPTHQTGGGGARPQPVRLYRLDGGRGREGRLQLRRHGRVRLQGVAGRLHDLRLPRHRAAPAGPGPQEADLLPQRHPAPPDGRPRLRDNSCFIVTSGGTTQDHRHDLDVCCMSGASYNGQANERATAVPLSVYQARGQ